jgi:hypothetical protein
MLGKYLEVLVYPDVPFGDKLGITEDIRNKLKEEHGICINDDLPGVSLEKTLNEFTVDNREIIHAKLVQSCRKLCMMWFASEQALEAEREFYSTTIKDAPALFGEDAIKINYHLESFVLIARSALDVASGVFGRLLPPPFKNGRYDSFNKLIKELQNHRSRLSRSDYFDELRANKKSWLSIISGHEKGRSLRDKIAHQTEFPLDYAELHPRSEKKSPIVILDKETWLVMDLFVDTLRRGVIECFIKLEKLCCDNIKALTMVST